MRDSPILILDEPTSSVDVHTEAAIIEATERLMSGRTTFMIAHRLGTLKSCDMLLVLDQGRLVEIKPVSLDGDAPSDILAAKANRARAVAVYTGISTREELLAHEPDLLVEDLSAVRLEMLLG